MGSTSGRDKIKMMDSVICSSQISPVFIAHFVVFVVVVVVASNPSLLLFGKSGRRILWVAQGLSSSYRVVRVLVICLHSNNDA